MSDQTVTFTFPMAEVYVVQDSGGFYLSTPVAPLRFAWTFGWPTVEQAVTAIRAQQEMTPSERRELIERQTLGQRESVQWQGDRLVAVRERTE